MSLKAETNLSLQFDDMATLVLTFNLPVELHLDTLDLLQPLDLYLLRGTCKYFRSIIEPLTMAQLMDAEEDWNQRKLQRATPGQYLMFVFDCPMCSRMRPEHDLGGYIPRDTTIVGLKDLGRWRPRSREERHCLCFACEGEANIAKPSYAP